MIDGPIRSLALLAALASVSLLQRPADAGTKNNIIPDQAEIGLTVRTYKPEVRRAPP